MAAKKQAAPVEKVKKAKPQIKVKIPKMVSASTDKFWRRAMIKAIKEQAERSRYSNSGKADKDLSSDE